MKPTPGAKKSKSIFHLCSAATSTPPPKTAVPPPNPASPKNAAPDKALDERKKCLTKLVSDGFIPADVLASLPSPDEILRKAEIAKARAASALAALESAAQPAVA